MVLSRNLKQNTRLGILGDLDSKRTCLVVIDLQKGIVGYETQPYEAKTVVSNAARLAAAFRKNKMQVFLVRADVSPGLWPHQKADWPMTFGELPKDWADIVPELGPEPTDVVITKRQWGAFYGTDLEVRLSRGGLDTIVLAGIATTYGVEGTARMAHELGYEQIFAEDAMSDFSKEGHKNAVELVLKRVGRVMKTSEILQALA